LVLQTMCLQCFACSRLLWFPALYGSEFAAPLASP
jgi:hypothetical protein